MAPPFVQFNGTWINVAHVQRIEFSDTPRVMCLYGSDGRVIGYADADDAEDLLEEVVPAATGERAVILTPEPDGELEIMYQPIIAWRLHTHGATPLFPQKPEDSAHVFVVGPEGSLMNSQHWFQDQQAAIDWLQEARKVARAKQRAGEQTAVAASGQEPRRAAEEPGWKKARVKILLDEEQFRDLVAGRMVEAPNATGGLRKIPTILADIGWDRMKAAIADAERALGSHKEP